MYVVKMKFILLSLALLLCFSSCDANLKKMVCRDEIKTFKNYVRLVYDTDFEDIDSQDVSCMFPTLEKQMNNQRDYIIQFGIRMSDTIKHDETDEDYFMVDTGMANVTLRPSSLQISGESDKKICDVQIFENEFDVDFSHKNIFNVQIKIKNNEAAVYYAPKQKRKWTKCGTIFASTYTKRHINVFAYSEFGINIDLINLDLNSKFPPWASKDILATLNSPEHALEHHQEIQKIHKNITNKEFLRIGQSVTYLWYYQWFLTTVLIFIVIKYKMDNKRKMHLL